MPCLALPCAVLLPGNQIKINFNCLAAAASKRLGQPVMDPIGNTLTTVSLLLATGACSDAQVCCARPRHHLSRPQPARPQALNRAGYFEENFEHRVMCIGDVGGG